MTRALDLGCGSRPKNPFDADEFYGVNVRDDLSLNIKKADLVVEPIPYESEYFDYVTAFDFIKHIPRLVYAPNRRNSFVELMNEIYRVLKPGGFFLSSTPAFPHGVAFRDPTHVNIITEETFPLYFDDNFRWASIYGFKGAFEIVQNEWNGPHIVAILRKKLLRDIKISVVIPVFNGEKYIQRTIESLLQQKFQNFEILCINDCSSDSSFELLNEFSKHDERVRVFKTPENLGNAAKVINFALDFSIGEYFVYSSQDDVFSDDWLESMHSRAIESGADAVIPDLVFYHESQKEDSRIISGLDGDRKAEISGREAFIYSLDWRIPGNALWKMDLVKRLKFDESGLNSDELTVRKLFLHSEKVVFSSGVFYYRQDNPSAVTKKIGCKTFDYPITQYRIYRLAMDNNIDSELVQKEALKVVKLIIRLKEWFHSNKNDLSAEDINVIDSKIENIRNLLKNDSMFDAVFSMNIFSN